MNNGENIKEKQVSNKKRKLFNSILDNNFWREIFLGKWVTVSLTGIFVFILAPRFQMIYQEQSKFYEHRLQIAQKTIKDFVKFREYHKKLIALALLENEPKKERGIDSLNKEFYQNKMNAVRMRNEYRSDLHADIAVLEIYFSSQQISEATKFLYWHKIEVNKEIGIGKIIAKFSSNPKIYYKKYYEFLQSLPSDKVLFTWQQRIARQLYTEIQ